MIVIKEIFLIILILLFTYYCTRWLSLKANSIQKSKYINIIDKAVLGQNKYLAIAEISEKYYLLSVSDNGINILKELDEFEFKVSENISTTYGVGLDFNKIFSKFKECCSKEGNEDKHEN